MNCDSAQPLTAQTASSIRCCLLTILRRLFPLMLLTLSLRAADPPNLEPLISISVNDSGSAEIYRGMPLLVSVVLLHPLITDSAVSPILLASEPGPWTNAVKLSISNANGDSQTWPFHTTVNPSNTIVLDSSHYAQLDWWLAPEQTSLLSTGQYTAEVSLNTTNVTLPDAWNGVADSVPADLQILDEPASLSEAQAENKYGQLAQYYSFLGNNTLALDQLNLLLATYPTNITGLRLKSIVLDALGRTVEAYNSCQVALAEAYARNPNAMEPPLNLLLLQRQLMNKLFVPVRLTIQLASQFVTLQWNSIPDRLYELQTSQNLRDWAPLVSGLKAMDTNQVWQTNISGVKQFFRVNSGP